MPDPPIDALPARRRELLELRRRIDERLESLDVRLSPATRPLLLDPAGADEVATAPVPAVESASRAGREDHTVPVPAAPAQVPSAAEPEGRRGSSRGLRRTVALVAAANVVGLSLLAAAAAGALGGGGPVVGASGPAAGAHLSPSADPAGAPTSTTSTTTTLAPPARPAGPTEVAATLPPGGASSPATATAPSPTTTSPTTAPSPTPTTTAPTTTTTQVTTTTVSNTTTTSSGG